jgi:protease-4
MRRFLVLLAVIGLVSLRAAPAPAQDSEKKETKKDHGKAVVAVFALKGELKEKPSEDISIFSGTTPSSLRDVVARLKKAAGDSAVKAVVILPEGDSIGSAQREELLQAMAQLKAAGKEVYVHADSLGMGDYVLASGASRISVVPTGDLWITGLYGESPYLRGLLDKLGVQPQYLHCGAYKSASEIFMRDGPSPEAEQMQNWLLDSIYQTDVALIAKERRVDKEKVRSWIDNGPYSADQAKEAGLIDGVEERHELQELLQKKYGKDMVLNKKYGKKAEPKVDLSSPFAVFNIFNDIMKESQSKKGGKPAVGIVYVEGAISLGDETTSPFGESQGARSGPIRKALEEAARDDSIKAVVLRVDSPGGSATASQIILDATRQVKSKKPLLVSMGNVAGSGGYFVACASDTIYADATTITASIGVVGGKFVTNPMWKKIGITFKEYERGAHAGLLSSARPFNKEEQERMQAWMDHIYGVFKGHVVSNRNSKLKKPIDELAGGRVFTGQQALELGLVDKIGTLEDAIKDAAAQAKLTSYDVRVVPKPENFVEKLMEELSGGKEDNKDLDLRVSRAVKETSLVELTLPYLQHLDPKRVKLITTALTRMQLLQREKALLMMPEIRVGD